MLIDTLKVSFNGFAILFKILSEHCVTYSRSISFQIKDCDFDELEKRYSHLTRFIQLFASDAQNFRKQLHDTVICQFNVAQNVADLYRERVHTREVERFRVAHQNILAKHWNEFVSEKY